MIAGKSRFTFTAFSVGAALLVNTLVFLLFKSSAVIPNAVAALSVVVIAVFCVSISWALWQSTGDQRAESDVWQYLTLGLGLWTIGEIVWSLFQVVLRQELPYPSLADAVWITGYLPLALGLLTRFINLRSRPSRGLLIGVGFLLAILLTISTVFVIVPILTSTDYFNPIEQLVNIFYPVGDLMVMAGALIVAFATGKDYQRTAWILIAAGFFIVSFSDLLYTYAAWNEIYWPNGILNPLTALVDLSYLAAYGFLLIGLTNRYDAEANRKGQ